jgi:hypothetical protein
MNALTNAEGTWIGDGGDGEIQQKGSFLTVQSATRGTPLNVRHSAAPTTGDWYFQVHLVKLSKESSISVGVANSEEMLPGWKTKGMFYNGNLTNGSAALVTSFGPYLKEGDSVGVFVTNNNRNVTFFHDGRCLGTGFELSDETSKTYCPCIHVSGEVQIRFEIPDSLPATMSKEGKTKGFVDEWKLIEAINDSGTAVAIPEGHDIVLHLDVGPDENQYDFSLRVANTLRCIGIKEEGGGIKMGMVMSTMMEPPPELREIEMFLSSSLSNVTHMELQENSNLLILNGGDSSGLKLVFERYSKTFKPLEKYTN